MGSICVVQKTFDKSVLPLNEAIFFNYCLIIHIDKNGPPNVDGKQKKHCNNNNNNKKSDDDYPSINLKQSITYREPYENKILQCK